MIQLKRSSTCHELGFQYHICCDKCRYILDLQGQKAKKKTTTCSQPWRYNFSHRTTTATKLAKKEAIEEIACLSYNVISSDEITSKYYTNTKRKLLNLNKSNTTNFSKRRKENKKKTRT